MKSSVELRQSPRSNLSCPEDKKWIWVLVFSLPSSLDFGQGGEGVFSFPRSQSLNKTLLQNECFFFFFQGLGDTVTNY